MDRNEIRRAFKAIGCKISFRTVSFMDLARADATVVKITRNGEELPSLFFGKEHRDQWLDVIELKNKFKLI